MMNQAMLRKMQQMKKDMERTQEEIMNTEFKTTVVRLLLLYGG